MSSLLAADRAFASCRVARARGWPETRLQGPGHRGWPELRLQGLQGTGGAHCEHLAHATTIRTRTWDRGNVEAERLVERLRVLPSRKAQSLHEICGKRYGPGGVRALGGGDTSGVHGEGPTQGCGGQGTRGAHGEHALHGRDAGGVPVERLVKPPLLSCRVERRACDAGRGIQTGGREGVEWRRRS